MTTYGDTDLGQHWPRQWLVAWRHQAITWTNVALLSVRSSNIHLGAISQKIPQPPITKLNLKVHYLNFHPNLLGANELILPGPSQTTKIHFIRCFSSFYMLYTYFSTHNGTPALLLRQFTGLPSGRSLEHMDSFAVWCRYNGGNISYIRHGRDRGW